MKTLVWSRRWNQGEVAVDHWMIWLSVCIRFATPKMRIKTWSLRSLQKGASAGSVLSRILAGRRHMGRSDCRKNIWTYTFQKSDLIASTSPKTKCTWRVNLKVNSWNLKCSRMTLEITKFTDNSEASKNKSNNEPEVKSGGATTEGLWDKDAASPLQIAR